MFKLCFGNNLLSERSTAEANIKMCASATLTIFFTNKLSFRSG